MEFKFNLKMWSNLATYIAPDNKQNNQQVKREQEELYREHELKLTVRTEENRFKDPWEF